MAAAVAPNPAFRNRNTRQDSAAPTWYTPARLVSNLLVDCKDENDNPRDEVARRARSGVLSVNENTTARDRSCLVRNAIWVFGCS